MKTAICACALIPVALAAVADKTALKSLYDQHRWFELRDAIQGQTAPPLYIGAVASAFSPSCFSTIYVCVDIYGSALTPNFCVTDSRTCLAPSEKLGR